MLRFFIEIFILFKEYFFYIEKVKNFLEVIFFIILFLCILSYLNLDPFKSCLFIIFSLIFSLPIYIIERNVWFRYFICLIFLRGVFVILVYFSGISSFNFLKIKLRVLILIFSLFLMKYEKRVNLEELSLFNFYRGDYEIWLFFIILILIIFLFFLSYIMNFGGGLRKI